MSEQRRSPDAANAYEDLTLIAEVLASGLHDHNIGRDLSGWEEVSEAFKLTKSLLAEVRPDAE